MCVIRGPWGPFALAAARSRPAAGCAQINARVSSFVAAQVCSAAAKGYRRGTLVCGLSRTGDPAVVGVFIELPIISNYPSGSAGRRLLMLSGPGLVS